MEELAKAVQKKYVEDITKKYPTHRFFVMFIVLISSYMYAKSDGVRILSELKEIKVNFILDFKSGLLASVSFEQLVVSIIVAGAIGYFYSWVSSRSFNVLSKSSSFNYYISEIKAKVDARKSEQELLNYFLAKDVSKELEGLRVKLKSFHTSSEVFVVISLCIGWGGRANSYLDWVIVMCFVFLVGLNIWKAFNFYISDFLPYYITEQTLLGATVEFGDK